MCIKKSVVGVAILSVMFYMLYRAFNPLYLNYIVIINKEYVKNTEIFISINDALNRNLYQHKVILNDFVNSKVLHFNGAWMGGTVVLQHNGIVERTGIGSSGRYSPTLFIEVQQHSPSRAGWDKIPSFVKDQKDFPSGELNGAQYLYTFEAVKKK